MILGRQRCLIDRRGIEGHRVFEFDLEGVVQLAVVAELPGEMEALRVLEGLARVQVGPDAPAERIGLPLEFLRLLVDRTADRRSW